MSDDEAEELLQDNERLRALNAELLAALSDATAHLAAAASAYRQYARGDAVFRTRANDFDKATERARAAFAKAKGETP